MSTAKRKYKLNENIFSKIDNEVSAYWLGFLYADGYNHTKKSSVTLCLHNLDINMLEKFSLFLETDKPIRRNTENSSKVVIENKKISKDLEKLGVIQAKTHKIEFPNFLDEKMEKHFIRGYFDGDGSITYGRKLNVSATISLVSTKNFLDEICKRIEIHFNYTKRHKNKEDNIYTINSGGICNILKFYNYLYKDSNIFLLRKKEKFEKWFEWYFENIKFKKSTLELKNKFNL